MGCARVSGDNDLKPEISALTLFSLFSNSEHKERRLGFATAEDFAGDRRGFEEIRRRYWIKHGSGKYPLEFYSL